MQRKIDFSIGEYYHIYNRGTEKRTIFLEPHNYQRFNALLYACNSDVPVDITMHFREGRSFVELFDIDRGETLVHVLAYCLMPNHFHLLLREKTKGGVARFMCKLSTGYSMYFNNKNERTGALFEGRFKAKHVGSDEYLKYLFAYIHLNPVKIIDPLWKENGIQNRSEAQQYLNSYTYSSYFEWKNEVRPESKILDREAAPEYFTTANDFNNFVNEWLTFEAE